MQKKSITELRVRTVWLRLPLFGPDSVSQQKFRFSTALVEWLNPLSLPGLQLAQLIVFLIMSHLSFKFQVDAAQWRTYNAYWNCESQKARKEHIRKEKEKLENEVAFPRRLVLLLRTQTLEKGARTEGQGGQQGRAGGGQEKGMEFHNMLQGKALYRLRGWSWRRRRATSK